MFYIFKTKDVSIIKSVADEFRIKSIGRLIRWIFRVDDSKIWCNWGKIYV